MIARPKKKTKENAAQEDGEATPSSRKRSRSSSTTAARKIKRAGDPGYDPYEFTSSAEEEEGEGEEDGAPTQSHDQGAKGDSGSAAVAPVAMDAERYGI